MNVSSSPGHGCPELEEPRALNGGFIMVNVADIALVAGYCFVLLPFVLTRISTRPP